MNPNDLSSALATIPAPRRHTPGPRNDQLAAKLEQAEQRNAELVAALYLIATDPSAIYSGANAHIGNIARAAIARATGGNAL